MSSKHRIEFENPSSDAVVYLYAQQWKRAAYEIFNLAEEAEEAGQEFVSVEEVVQRFAENGLINPYTDRLIGMHDRPAS